MPDRHHSLASLLDRVIRSVHTRRCSLVHTRHCSLTPLPMSHCDCPISFHGVELLRRHQCIDIPNGSLIILSLSLCSPLWSSPSIVPSIVVPLMDATHRKLWFFRHRHHRLFLHSPSYGQQFCRCHFGSWVHFHRLLLGVYVRVHRCPLLFYY